MEYNDNPDKLIHFLKSLNPSQLEMYMIGYSQGCIHIREALSKGQSELLTEILAAEDESDLNILNACLSILDRYEQIVAQRELMVSRMFPKSRTQNVLI